MFQEILQLNIFAFLLVFARIGTAFFLLPGFSSMQIPMRMRLTLAIAVSFLVTPALISQMPPLPGAPMMIFVLVGSEILSGAILATVPMILLAAVHIAGTIISFISGIANALTFDPVVQEQSAIVSGFLSTVALTLIFVTDMHHIFIRAVLESYELFRPGVMPNIGDATQMITRQVADTFLVGVQMSTPFIVVNFAYNLGLGILTRLAPQVPVFFIATPIQLIVSLVLMMLATSGIMLVLLNHMADGMRPFLTP
jgi:flagellar biosynthetic protein FliR